MTTEKDEDTHLAKSPLNCVVSGLFMWSGMTQCTDTWIGIPRSIRYMLLLLNPSEGALEGPR